MIKKKVEFAKLFLSDQYGQILVRRLPSEDAHIVEISYFSEDSGFVFFNFDFQKNQAGFDSASDFYSAIDMGKVLEIVGDVIAVNHRLTTIPVVYH